MATDRPLESTASVEHRSTRTGRWLRANRIKFSLWIAVGEGIIVAFTHYSRWVVIALAIPLLAIYVFWGRHARSDTARQVSWIGGASQSLAVVVVILSFLIYWLALVTAGVFAAIALLFLLSDRG